MRVVDITYHEDDVFESSLQSIGQHGDFCAHGRLSMSAPRLEIRGAGMLAFPVSEGQLQAVMKVAERATSGRGPGTVTDPSVRGRWQIGPEQVRFAGDEWPKALAKILNRAANGLGLPVELLDARFRKLFLFAKCGSVATHLDTEKARGMIATLTISLPVAGEGGQLVVRRHGRETTADMTAESQRELAFAAFFTDCPHEIRPIVSGHRLALVYDLFPRPDARPASRPELDSSKAIDAIAARLEAWRCDDGGPEKVVWLLDHKYNSVGLSFESLKNADDARARALAEAADRAAFDLHAVIIRIEEHGTAAYRGESVHFESWKDRIPPEMGYMEDPWIWHRFDSWVSRDGTRPPFGEFDLIPGELSPRGALDDSAPDVLRLRRVPGKETAYLNRIWHRAALVLWPRSQALTILSRRGIDRAIAWVDARFQRSNEPSDPEIRQQASDLVGMWSSGRSGRNAETRNRMLGLLSEIGDRSGLARFLSEVIVPDYTGRENENLPAALDNVGPETAGRFLLALVDARFPERSDKVLKLLRVLGDDQNGSESPVGEAVQRQAVQSAIRAVLAEAEAREGTRPWRSNSGTRDAIRGQLSKSKRLRQPWQLSTAAVRDLFTLAWRWRLTDDAAAAAHAIVSVQSLARPERTLPAALEELFAEPGLAESAAYAALWHGAAQALLDRSRVAPSVPVRWTIDCAVDCTCELCTRLRSFCDDPVAQVARFELTRPKRSHLPYIIKHHRLDIDHVLERHGRDISIVCTKTRAGHERRLKEYSLDIRWMRRLIRAAPGDQQQAEADKAVARLREAIAVSGSG